jgi:Phosphotransferase enzyme family
MSLPAAQRSVLEGGLSERLGYPIRLGVERELRAGRVFRFSVDPVDPVGPVGSVGPVGPVGGGLAPVGIPMAIIAKAIPLFERTATTKRQFANEVAALEFLAASYPEMAPRLLVADADALVLGMEDLGGLPSLSDVLIGSDATRATEAMVELARTIGRLHRRSVGRSEDYYLTRQRIAEVDRETDRFFIRRRDVRGCLEEVRDLTQQLGLPGPDEGVAAEFEGAMELLREPGDCLAFTTGDPCPDNEFIDHGSVRLIDFEVAAFRHALLDVAYFVLPFPNCWCWRRLPDSLTAAMLSAYKTEVLAAMPSIAVDEDFDAALTRCCLAWLVFHLATRLPWIGDTNREHDLFNERERLIAMLRNFVALPATSDLIPSAGAWLLGLADELARRWPEQTGPIKLYPVFGG